MRQEVWPIVANLKSIKNDSHYFYDELIAKENWVYQDEIMKDVVVTFKDNIFFIRDVGKEAITDILKAVSFAFPSMGYKTGMNFIAGFFSFYLSNEESFWMFVYLFEKRGMFNYFKYEENLERFYYISDKLVEKYLEKIHKHMVGHILTQTKCRISLDVHIKRFILSFFTEVLPISFCCRIFDIYLFENEKIIFRAILSIFKFIEPIILEKVQTIEDLSKINVNPVKFFPNLTSDLFIDQCLKFNFSQTLIGKLEFEFNSRPPKAD